MSKHLGDYDTSTVIYGKFSTFRPSTGAAFTLGGTPALSVYKDNSVTQSTTGVTLTVDFDSVTGLHHFAIDTSADGTFYAAGSFFDIVITTGTVDSVSVVGSVVASFTLRKDSGLKPTTAGRTITVDASGRTDVGSFGGSAGTFSGGRPEVNATHFAGTAYVTALAAEIDATWDEVLSAAAHNVAGSAGRRLRQLGASSITGGTAQAGASNSITLAAGESATNEIYDNNLVVIVGGTGAGQSRVIVEYNGTSKVATIDEVWVTTPDNTSEYEILADHQAEISQHGLAQAGAATTITLSSTASATDDVYVGSTIYLSTSTGSGQARLITDYDGATKVATVSPAWAVNPGANSVYKILPIGRTIVDSGTVTTVSGNVNGSVGSVTGAVGSVTGAVGSVTGAVGSVTGAVGSVTGLTASDVAAIKAKTDSLAFTVAGQVDANVQYVNDVAVTGTGAVGDEWGP